MDNALARRGALALWDVGGWALAAALVIGVRHDFALNEVQWESVVWYWVLASVLLVALGYASKFYRGRYLVGSFDEVFGLAFHIAAVGAATVVVSAMLTSPPPRSVVVLTPALAVLISASGRFVYRSLRDRDPAPTTVDAGRRLLIYGAGDAGRQVLQLMRGQRDQVVGFLDDNPGKRHLRSNGVA